jgi:hypothetical protein
MNDYRLIFDTNGVLVATFEGQIRTLLVVLRFGLKEFMSICVKKIMGTYGPQQWKTTFQGSWKLSLKKLVFTFCSLG